MQRAASEGHLETVELLLKHGGDVARQDTVVSEFIIHYYSLFSLSNRLPPQTFLITRIIAIAKLHQLQK